VYASLYTIKWFMQCFLDRVSILCYVTHVNVLLCCMVVVKAACVPYKIPVYITNTTSCFTSTIQYRSACVTVKPFNLAALKVGDFTYKIILAPFILANLNHIIPTHA